MKGLDVLMVSPKGLRTWAISSKKIKKSEEFYGKILGGEVLKRSKPGLKVKAGPPNTTDVRLGNIEVHIFDDKLGPHSNIPHHTLAFPWIPQGKFTGELESQGVKIEWVRKHHGPKGYSVYVKDPDGNTLELSIGAAG